MKRNMKITTARFSARFARAVRWKPVSGDTPMVCWWHYWQGLTETRGGLSSPYHLIPTMVVHPLPSYPSISTSVGPPTTSLIHCGLDNNRRLPNMKLKLTEHQHIKDQFSVLDIYFSNGLTEYMFQDLYDKYLSRNFFF